MSKITKILLIEDERPIRDVIAAELVAEGYDVTPAKNGLEAIDLLGTNETWHLVLSDFAMPEATGLDVLAFVRKHRPGLPVIIMTGILHLGLPDWKGVGAVASLEKPFKLSTLFKLIREIEEGSLR